MGKIEQVSIQTDGIPEIGSLFDVIWLKSRYLNHIEGDNVYFTHENHI